MNFKPPEAPHFFKIIHPQIVQHGRLRIPKKFVANYGKELSDRVYLKVPNGDLWIVNLINSNGEVCLQDGWKEFADHYSIGLYHFLVFRYEGNSHFLVLIFDMSASEIEYPSPKSLHEERTDLNGEPQIKRKSLVDDSPVSNRKKRSNLTHEEQYFEGIDASNITRASGMKNVKLEEEPHSFDLVKQVGESKGMASDAEKEKALQSAKAFTSENPFFMATLKPYFMKCNVIVPRSFRDRYFSNNNTDRVNITLSVSGRTWPVIYDATVKKLSKGWTAFARENCLQVGDICVFELIKGSKNFLNVVIFRAAKDANC